MAAEKTQQNLLANIYQVAQLRHAMRQLDQELVTLQANAMRNANLLGISAALIAKAAGLTPGRVSQVMADSPGEDRSPQELNDTTTQILEWPAEALKKYHQTFPGEMTYPPYPAPRKKFLKTGHEGRKTFD